MKTLALVGTGLAFALSFTVGCCLCGNEDRVPNPDAPDKYAVLASTEIATEDDVKYNSEFWYDLVLTYCTLIEQGFESDNIFVLYGDGTDGNSKYDPYKKPFCGGAVEKITDMGLKDTIDISKNNLCNVLCCLSSGRPAQMVSGTCECLSSGDTGIDGFKCADYEIPWLTDKDFLISWVKGHGAASECETALAFKSGTTLGDAEIQALVADLKPDRWALLFETCDAGGWLGEFKNVDSSAVVVSSSPDVDECKQTSWTATYGEKDPSTGVETKVFHGRFSYWVNAALREFELAGTEVDSDPDGNNLVSISEDFNATKQKIDAENSAFAVSTVTNSDVSADLGGKMDPAINSQDGIAPCVFIRLPNPGDDDEVFSMDDEDDNSIIPSSMTAPFESPDIWVRHNHTGSVPQPHQPPNAGKDNHVYARVFNIGCADPGPVKVAFYYSPYTNIAMCGDPTQWKVIGDDSITNLPVGETHIFHSAWQASNVPPPGDYCLIAELSAPKDLPNDDESVAFDNNKAQIKVQVVAP